MNVTIKFNAGMRHAFLSAGHADFWSVIFFNVAVTSNVSDCSSKEYQSVYWKLRPVLKFLWGDKSCGICNSILATKVHTLVSL